MAVEIERKFLVKSDTWWAHVDHSTRIRQGYLAPVGTSSVRVRIEGEKANINIKSASLGISRLEYEYGIPLADAEEMLDQLCPKPQIDKTRHRVNRGQHVWEIDEFFGDNSGLLVAEIELSAEDELFEIPDWLGREVSDDPRYYNVNLIAHPYKNW